MRHSAPVRFVTLLCLAALAACSASAENRGDAWAPGDKREGTTDISAFRADLATEWFDVYQVLLQQSPGITPPVAARAVGYAGVTLYESLVHGMPGYVSMEGTLQGLTKLPQPSPKYAYDWPTVANSAMADITRKLFMHAPADKQAIINSYESRFNEEFRRSVEESVFNRSADFGRHLAGAIFEWSKTDGGHEAYMKNFPASYTPPTGDGLWERTPRLDGSAPQDALQPTWGTVRTFLTPETGSPCTLPPPPEFSAASNSMFRTQAQEVYAVSEDLTPDQTAIARFWSDDPGKTPTPPGHSLSIATQLLRQHNANLPLAAETYLKTGIAVADSFIDCWKSKFEYNVLRPVTYIREHIDADWMPLLETPPFPEYPSGHSVQTAAAVEVLKPLFPAAPLTDTTHFPRGMKPRTFQSLDDLAREAAMSRLYGGIHYRAAIENGLTQGSCIGRRVNSLKLKE